MSQLLDISSLLSKRVTPPLLIEAVAQAAQPGLPKHIQLSNGIVDLIRRGSLKVGDQILPEQQLAQVLEMSLGTVQKTLNRLAIEGWIVREHGRGTFISDPNRPTTDLWHYRFLDHFRFVQPRSGEPLPVYSSLLSRRIVEGDTTCRARLGDESQFVEITRRIDVGGKFTCRSDMYLSASRFGKLLELPTHAFENVNLKKIFAEQFSAPTLGLTQTVRLERLSAKVARVLGLPTRTCGLVLEIFAWTHEQRPLSFQRVFIPRSPYSLDVSPQPIIRTRSG